MLDLPRLKKASMHTRIGRRANWIVVLTVLVAVATGMGCGVDHYAKGHDLSVAEYHQTLDFEAIDQARLNAAIFHATNEARVKHGRAPVKYSEVLERASQRFAERSAQKRFLAHHDPTSESLKTPKARVQAAGGKNAMPAENLATTPGLKIRSGERLYVIDAEQFHFARDPEDPPIESHSYASFARNVVEQWLRSPGHRENLLSKDALELGCGAAFYTYEGPPNFVAVQKFQLYEPLE